MEFCVKIPFSLFVGGIVFITMKRFLPLSRVSVRGTRVTNAKSLRYHRQFTQSSEIVNEVNRVMANPEDAQGNPVALDFSKGSKTKGYSKLYGRNYDSIFQTAPRTSSEGADEATMPT